MSLRKLALVQIKPRRDPEANLKRAAEMVEEAKDADMIVLPESFAYPFGVPFDNPNTDALIKKLSEMAKVSESILVAGTIPEVTDNGVYNTCYVFDKNGNEIGKYRKIHLFDVTLPELVTRESDRFLRGSQAKAIETDLGKIGLAVCFDVRFPEMFISLANQGAKTIIVPAAFSNKTGPDHWELLLKARALDSQCFIAGCAPARNPDLDFVVYGNSMLVDPYGTVLERLDEGEGVLRCSFDDGQTEYERQAIPVLKSRNPSAYGLDKEEANAAMEE